jgi:hypothetical protein
MRVIIAKFNLKISRDPLNQSSNNPIRSFLIMFPKKKEKIGHPGWCPFSLGAKDCFFNFLL